MYLLTYLQSYITQSDNWRPICFTSDVLTNRRNIRQCPALLWHIYDSGIGYKTADLLTHLQTIKNNADCNFLL